jgi:hypothetical protein
MTAVSDAMQDPQTPGRTDGSGPTPPGPFTFRVSQLALFVVITLTVCVTPLAISKFWLLELYVIPIGLWVWIRRNGTTVSEEGITARGMFRSRRVAWDDVTALRLRTRSRVSAVLTSGPELPLPAVHLRDLPLLAAVSNGRIPDPTAATEPDEPARPGGSSTSTASNTAPTAQPVEHAAPEE